MVRKCSKVNVPKVYVWNGVANMYADGHALAVAYSVEQARGLLMATFWVSEYDLLHAEEYGESDKVKDYKKIMGEPDEIHDIPYAYVVMGGE